MGNFSKALADNKNSKYEYITGLVERVTYHNEENGFAVIRVKIKQKKDLVTVTGAVPSVSVGEEIQAQGNWVNDLKYGLGFKAYYIRTVPPTSIEGIEKYLGSGLIRGIGPHFAKRLIAAFNKDVFDIIENSPERLNEVEGIGKVRAESIAKNWFEQKVIREIMVFLQSHGIGTSRATRIYKTYGEDAIKIVSENPYQLARDIKGIGFLSADRIAIKLGIEHDSLIRARSGVNFILLEALNEGHCGLPQVILLQRAHNLLKVAQAILEEAIKAEISENFIVFEVVNGLEMLFLGSFYAYERNIAIKLMSLASGSMAYNEIDSGKAISWAENKLSLSLAENQIAAITKMLESKVSVITGGPGTGKTTIMKVLLLILRAKGYKLKLTAPTGRAAKRLSESTGIEALTIHRLLEFNPQNGGFNYNQDHNLNCDLLIIDEASMLDVQLFNNLLKAISPKTGLILVGDVDQLPSVGAGQVLKDIIDSNKIGVVKLDKIFRQGEGSDIITNAHLVNDGKYPRLDTSKASDFHFIEADSSEDIVNKVIRFTKYNVLKYFNLDPIRDTQILCPMQRGGCGARSLNIELQKALNPNLEIKVEKYGQVYSIGDKVMQVENNYDKEVYNGDTGFITDVNQEEGEITVLFDKREVVYHIDELDELSIAYAVTIHKSQGSEYPVVIIPISLQHFSMLAKNLLYTAITRGKQQVVLIGQKKAIAIAVKNRKDTSRYTKLLDWLKIS